MKNLQLYIDTAGEQARVSLSRGDKLLGERSWSNDRSTGVRLLEYIDELVAEAGITLDDIDEITVNEDSQRYGAVRAGVVTGEVICFVTSNE